MTVRDLIKGALRLIGAVDADSALTANEAADGMEALNGLVGSLANDELLVYTINKETFNVTGGTATYTLGPSGAWNTTRPVRIDAAKYLVGDDEFDLHICTDQEWQSIENRAVSGFPEFLHNSDAFPLSTVSLWPVPSASDQVVLFTWKQIGAFSAVTDVISLPPGYERMLRYNLAIELAPEYSKEPSGAVVSIARESKAELKRINAEPIYLECDDALLGRWR